MRSRYIQTTSVREECKQRSCACRPATRNTRTGVHVRGGVRMYSEKAGQPCSQTRKKSRSRIFLRSTTWSRSFRRLSKTSLYVCTRTLNTTLARTPNYHPPPFPPLTTHHHYFLVVQQSASYPRPQLATRFEITIYFLHHTLVFSINRPRADTKKSLQPANPPCSTPGVPPTVQKQVRALFPTIKTFQSNGGTVHVSRQRQLPAKSYACNKANVHTLKISSINVAFCDLRALAYDPRFETANVNDVALPNLFPRFLDTKIPQETPNKP